MSKVCHIYNLSISTVFNLVNESHLFLGNNQYTGMPIVAKHFQAQSLLKYAQV